MHGPLAHLRIAYQPKKSLGPVLEPIGDGTGRQRTKGDLGPNQIAWLNAKSERFREAKEAADRSIAHSAETARKIEGKP